MHGKLRIFYKCCESRWKVVLFGFIIYGLYTSVTTSEKKADFVNLTTKNEDEQFMSVSSSLIKNGSHARERNQANNSTAEHIKLRAKLNTLGRACEALVAAQQVLGLYVTKYTGVDEAEICKEYHSEASLKRTQISEVWKRHLRFSSSDVTLVTQMTANRIHLLDLLASHWPGPFSVAIYCSRTSLLNLTETFKNYPRLLERNNLDIHLVHQLGVYHPVNQLRNIALDNAATDYVFLTDIDFVPSLNLYSVAKAYLTKYATKDKQVLVVPAFEFFETPKSFPESKEELLGMWDENLIQPFDMQAKFAGSYEPYILAKRATLPRYNEAFVGRIQDKVSHLLEVFAMQFKFLVLPDVFMIHYPHPNTNKKPNYMRCALKMYREFRDYITKLYKSKVIV